MITADSNKKFKLCIMEFSPNVLAMAIVNKEAEQMPYTGNGFLNLAF
jgi:hypothetical protein